MNASLPQPSDTSRLLAALMETMLGTKSMFGQTRSKDATMLQIQALGLLHTTPYLSPTALGQRLYLSSSATAQLLQRLADSGWVGRRSSPADLRAVELFLTKKGTMVLGKYGEAQDKERLREVFGSLSAEEKQHLASLLTKLNEAFRRNNTDEKE